MIGKNTEFVKGYPTKGIVPSTLLNDLVNEKGKVATSENDALFDIEDNSKETNSAESSSSSDIRKHEKEEDTEDSNANTKNTNQSEKNNQGREKGRSKASSLSVQFGNSIDDADEDILIRELAEQIRQLEEGQQLVLKVTNNILIATTTNSNNDTQRIIKTAVCSTITLFIGMFALLLIASFVRDVMVADPDPDQAVYKYIIYD